MKHVFLIIFSLLVTLLCFAQKQDKKLASIVRQHVTGFRGDIGIYIKNLRTGRTFKLNADTLFPTASVIKIPILLGVVSKIHEGALGYEQELVYHDSLLYEGVDILGSFKSGEKITLRKLVMLMLTTSDNTASLWLQSLSGTGTRINKILDSMQLVHTRVNSRTAGRESNRSQFGWGQTTPAEMGTLMELIYRNEIFPRALHELMMRCLGRNFWDQNEAISQVPPYIEVFSKNGCVDAVRNEVLLVNAPHNPYIFCIFTKNNRDTSWKHENEAWTLARNLSRALWNYFEPKDRWSPSIH
jgi:beta-lactamase class A